MAIATNPFVFIGCVELRQALDRHALDERELMDRLEEVPAGSIFYHTHGYFLRHRPVTMAYGNDFARWVASRSGTRRSPSVWPSSTRSSSRTSRTCLRS